MLLVIPVAIKIYYPIYFKLQLTSCYEYLGIRFGKEIRIFGAILYILQVKWKNVPIFFIYFIYVLLLIAYKKYKYFYFLIAYFFLYVIKRLLFHMHIFMIF